MTEPDLVQVLQTRFNVDRARLETLMGQPDFAKRLFKELVDARYAHGVLIDIFNRSICIGHELCEAEKAIIREVKTWPDKTASLSHVCNCFFDHDLTTTTDRFRV